MTAAACPEDLVRAVRAAGVRDERLLRAVRSTPRVGFVPPAHAAHAYEDAPIPIAHGQVTTQPSLSATMIEGLALTGVEHVLEVGSGLGYQTALLARMAGDVVGVDLWPDLVRAARRNLARQGIRNAEVRVGDGGQGVREHAPYDAVIVSAAFPTVPAPLVEQLRPGGRLVQPIGTGGREEVVLFERTVIGLEPRQVLTLASFVRLHGRFGYPS
ncbi:protein-L-isoaspartate(D-aspartate) O-methyltransferase [Microbispora tritici]|uniref:Protein-L-isoaspartate O-methyltransferase n=2 Tax=Microbispora TaxID=2005 RepID=A0ABY3M3Q7_9ACTN|nr:protein-L-isoaspartate(D-aspartate) O-methyltransferase [Microbispora fusca]TYB65687.1 protein-L-isoaspartate(D-aspartate) O-methyltransferase [Microbispora tritici]